MRCQTELRQPGQRSPTLLVLLPPALSRIEDFAQHGFIAALRQQQLPVDLLLADATAQHVLDGDIAEQLQRQVLQPAQALGYRQIWLAGISIGAYSALCYAAVHGAQLAGLLLLAPYPGTGDVVAEIRGAGGAAAWHQRPPVQAPHDERQWWHWLCQASASGHWPTPVYFASGNADRFAAGQNLLAELLPAQHCRRLPGRHDWATWKALWEDWLVHGPLQNATRQDLQFTLNHCK